MANLEVRRFGVDKLQTFHRNPHVGDVDLIAASLEARGQYRTIVVNEGTLTGRPLEVLAGNHTLLAARKLGWETIEATTVDVDDDDAARIVIADNRIAAVGGYDDGALLEVLQAVGRDRLDTVGYSPADLNKLLRQVTPPDHDDEDGGPADGASLVRIAVRLTAEERDTVEDAMRAARERGGLDAGNRNGAALAAVARAILPEAEDA